MDMLREEAQAQGRIVVSHLGKYEWSNVIVIDEKGHYARYSHAIHRLSFCVLLEQPVLIIQLYILSDLKSSQDTFNRSRPRRSINKGV